MGCANSADTTSPATSSRIPKASFLDRYERGCLLGNGTFAKVYAVARRSDLQAGDNYSQASARSGLAVKVIDFDSSGAHIRKLVEQEVECWHKVGLHNNCVQLHDTITDGSYCYMIMERCDSTLLTWLRKFPIACEANADRLFCDMLATVAHVHSVGLIHRDIKPPNFLVGANSKVKLCDFGLSIPFRGTGLITALKGVHGTAPFMSPEMVAGEGYDELTDIWSLGATAYFILYGHFPYGRSAKTSAAMKSAIKAGKPPSHERAIECKFTKPIVEVSAQRAFKLLTEGLLQRDAELRPSAEAAWQARLESLGLSKTSTPVHPSTECPSSGVGALSEPDSLEDFHCERPSPRQSSTSAFI